MSMFRDFDSLFNEFENFFNSNFKNVIKNETSNEGGKWERQTYRSEDGLLTVFTFKRNFKSDDKNDITKLKSELSKCVENQEYEKAAELRDLIESLEKGENSKKEETIKDLESNLAKAIESQDFESAIKYRDLLKQIK